jgi:hypothetical protein
MSNTDFTTDYCNSTSVVPELDYMLEWGSLGRILEKMPVLEPHPRPTESESLEAEPKKL